MADEEQNPVDQLIDLFVYAPVGLLYEYDEVIPKLVRRGKSQVQLARVIGRLALNRGGTDGLNQLADGFASVLARQITEIGVALGLAPTEAGQAPTGGPETKTDGDGAAPVGLLPPPPGPEDASQERDEATAEGERVKPLPIARYDDLKAKEIITLLDDLDEPERARIRAHEEANRARKTVLGKLDRLAG